MTTIELPPDYALVIVSFVATFFTLFYFGMRVVAARREYNVPLPIMYDVSKPRFCGVQRGHQNALETYPPFVAALLLGGVAHPWLAAACGVMWCIGRDAYQRGYATGKPADRYRSKLSALSFLAYVLLVGACLSLAWQVYSG